MKYRDIVSGSMKERGREPPLAHFKGLQLIGTKSSEAAKGIFIAFLSKYSILSYIQSEGKVIVTDSMLDEFVNFPFFFNHDQNCKNPQVRILT